MPRLRIMMMPKCTGSTPNFMTIGRKIGVQIRSIGARSMNVPSTSSRTLMRRSSVYLSSAIERKNSAACARHLHDRHHVAEGDREADHDHHHADGAHDAADEQVQLAPFVVAIDEHRDDEGVDAGDRRRFRRREDAAQDAAEDDEDGEQAPERLDARSSAPARGRIGLALRKVVAPGDDEARAPSARGRAGSRGSRRRGRGRRSR